MRSKKNKADKYKPEDYEIWSWPLPPSGDLNDYGPTDMQEPLFIYHKEEWERPHFHTLDIVLMIGAAAGGKCWQRGTKILTYRGKLVNVEDIKVGDLLMGPDSKPRKVTSLGRGREPMAKIVPLNGEPFVCNESHILTLERSIYAPMKRVRKDGSIYIKPPRYGGDKIINVSVKDYLTWSTTKKKHFKLYRADSIDFPGSKAHLELDPYLLGAWLGDGSSNCAAITTMDPEIRQAFQDYVDTHDGVHLRVGEAAGRATTYYITRGMEHRTANSFHESLKTLGVLRNKHIPQQYKTASREDRLQLIAGLLDTDGYYHNRHFDITQKNKSIAEDIAFICRSLGFAAYVKEIQKSCMTASGKLTGTYYAVDISGDLNLIPTRLPRKQAEPRKSIKSVLHTGFSVEMLPEDDYYGFSVDKDSLYLLGDFTVVHNSAATIAETIEVAAAFP